LEYNHPVNAIKRKLIAVKCNITLKLDFFCVEKGVDAGRGAKAVQERERGSFELLAR